MFRRVRPHPPRGGIPGPRPRAGTCPAPEVLAFAATGAPEPEEGEKGEGDDVFHDALGSDDDAGRPPATHPPPARMAIHTAKTQALQVWPFCFGFSYGVW